MKREDILRDVNQDKAIAKLHNNAGWIFIQDIMKEKQQRLEKKIYSIDPNDSVEIAKVQGELKILREFIDKPKQYFERLKANGG